MKSSGATWGRWSFRLVHWFCIQRLLLRTSYTHLAVSICVLVEIMIYALALCNE